MIGKKAAMEMSVGTIVTIVLLMAVLIMGLILTKTIFTGSIQNINSIDQSVQNQINQLFSQDATAQVVIYPSTRIISVSKGNTGGFGFSIRNTDTTDGIFSYKVSVVQVASNCQMSSSDAANLIVLGGSGDNIKIPSGSILANPILVDFNVPSSAPLCSIRYGLDITKGGQEYLSTVTVDLQITA